MVAKRQFFIIAEMACSHEGNVDLARKIIDGAGKAGADAIQFQIWRLADHVVPHHPEYNKLSKLELSQSAWYDLSAYVRVNYPEMKIIACVYERSSVDFAERINVDAYKLHSSDLSNPYMIKYVSETGRKIDLSVGASTLDEIQKAIEWIREISNPEIWLMYGLQNFPTKINEVNLSYMKKIKELFELPIGYQDHSDPENDAAYYLPATALGIGADILEKHITHNRSLKGVDHEAALNPDEFARFVRMVRTIEEGVGVSVPKPFSSAHIDYRKYSKKSLVLNKRLFKGDLIKEDDITFMRADRMGLRPDQAHRILHKATRKDIDAYHLILEEDVI